MSGEVIFFYYVGLLVFGLNGLIFIGLHNRARRIEEAQERVRRWLLARRR